MGIDLVGVRHRPQGRRSRRGSRSPGETMLLDPTALVRGRASSTRAGRRPRRATRSRRSRRLDAALTRQRLGAARPSPTPSFGQVGSAAGVSSRKTARSRPASTRSSTCSTRAASATRSSASKSTSSRSCTSRTTSWSRSPPLRAAAHRARAARRPRPWSTPAQPHQYVYMIRDLGDKRSRPGSSRIGSLHRLLRAAATCCTRRDRGSRSTARAARAQSPAKGVADGPVPARHLPDVLAILFGALSFLASRLLAPRRPSAAKEAPYECGIVPSRDHPSASRSASTSSRCCSSCSTSRSSSSTRTPVDREFLGASGSGR